VHNGRMLLQLYLNQENLHDSDFKLKVKNQLMLKCHSFFLLCCRGDFGVDFSRNVIVRVTLLLTCLLPMYHTLVLTYD
jgi:hypothetical protein